MADLRETLNALARCERELDDLQRRKAQLPETITAALARAQQARDTIAERQRELAEAEKARRTKEGELRDHEARRQKFQGQTALVKTNEEYTALLQQIADAGERISQTEDEILVAMDTAEGIAGTITQLVREQKAIEQAQMAEADALRGQLAEVEKAFERGEGQREVHAKELPGPLFSRYARTRSGTGAGTASLAGRTCSRCHRDVPYETINRMRAGEGQFCGNCARLLVLPESDAPPAAS